MKSILPLTSALSDTSKPSLFLGIRTDVSDGGQFLSLTPKVMKWSEDTYLLDLTSVHLYWSQLAREVGLSFVEYLSSILSELTTANTTVTLASHPWHALLLLCVAADRPTLNFLDAQSHLGRKLLQDTTWSHWISRCHELRDHFMEYSGKDAFGSLLSLSKTINRLQFTHVSQMSDIDSPAMHRRFGKLAATAWRWTWSSSQSEKTNHSNQSSLFEKTDQKTFGDDFPWLNIAVKESPYVSRYIETHLRHWDHISPLLSEDLDKLCNLTCWTSNERVVSLEWVLSFSCSPSLRIPVLFRHPHSLHRESGHHKTALLQAFHCWQSANSSQKKPEKAGDTYISDDSITDWTLTVRDRLMIDPQVRSIFKDDLSQDSSKLQRLENSLPVPLIEYCTSDHYCPEYSFEQQTHIQREITSKMIAFDNIAKIATHQRRPLFIYQNPQKPQDQDQSSGLIFSERVATTWWSKESVNTNTCRDYYIRMTDDGLLQWVFQNDDGTFRVHGIYG